MWLGPGWSSSSSNMTLPRCQLDGRQYPSLAGVSGPCSSVSCLTLCCFSRSSDSKTVRWLLGRVVMSSCCNREGGWLVVSNPDRWTLLGCSRRQFLREPWKDTLLVRCSSLVGSAVWCGPRGGLTVELMTPGQDGTMGGVVEEDWVLGWRESQVCPWEPLQLV